ncbi:GerAB/ArcD/ProY family transporter [Bacillus sp. UMB0728]|uniref:GerAB/ArcD/ProY family transporter n=1 Tax=Bacillus sp. UMB0728 TaxID=2066052 RepID=UPI000C76DAEB|nr:GerAB/ArcD/ProY family transporter [Bacillus sp. UMB0728]PLR70639.1 spore gernimation protein KC [Bacillus sp. UMB0728]
MLKESISLSQLMTLVINFLLGSAIIIGVGKGAEQDAWIAMVISTGFGMGIVYFYWFLISRLPGKNLYEIMEHCFKRYLVIPMALLYVIYFLYISSRVVRDFGELIASAILPNTPIEMISLTIALTMGYILYLGIEVLGRTSEIFSPYVVLFVLLLTIFLLASGNLEFSRIEPVLGEGIMPVAKAVFPSLFVFPFGELIAFTVILGKVTSFKYVKRVSLMGTAIAGLLLTHATILMVMTLGSDAMVRSNFPMLSAARQVSIGNFIERIDALVVFIMMLGILIKGSVFLFGALKGLEYVFRLPYRYFALPMSAVVSLFSVLISVNFADHLEEGLVVVPYFVHLPMQFGIPSVLLAVLLWKNRSRKRFGKNGVKC